LKSLSFNPIIVFWIVFSSWDQFADKKNENADC